MVEPPPVAAAPRLRAYDLDPVAMAQVLIGQRLVRVIGGRRLAGTIVEVEAYLGAADRAAHTYGGRRTPRNESMYLAGGHCYVYMVYGLHHCLNVVCGAQDEGVAVLVRALEPTEGLEQMRARRGGVGDDRLLCSGPARLAQALAIDRALDGEDLRSSSRLWIEELRPGPAPARAVERCRRIGVAYAGPWAQRLLRFCARGSPFVSRR
jgi:DNA-3-methyladenine glycosylase